MKDADVVVVGGGIIGLATAYYLVREGVHDVVVMEHGRIGDGSTPRAAGMIRQQFAHPLSVRLARRTLEIYHSFAHETGIDPGLRQIGYLVLARTEQEAAAAQSAVEVQRAEGLEAHYVDAAGTAALFPELNVEGIAGAGYCPSDGYVDPQRVLQGYAAAARQAGVAILEETAATGIAVSGGRVSGVHTPAGEIATQIVVNAAGAAAGAVAALAGDHLPIVGMEHQIVLLGAEPEPQRRPMVVDFGRGYYFYRRHDGLLVGMGGSGDRPGAPAGFDEESWQVTRTELERRLPAAVGAEVTRRWTGIVDYTPDNLPVLGPSRAVEGLFMVAAAGHGIMYGPGLAEAAARLLTVGAIDPALHELAPARFDRPADAATDRVEAYSFTAPAHAFKT